MYGTDAISGVINIVTRSSEDTHGTLVQLGFGDEGRRELALRHGGAAAVFPPAAVPRSRR